MQNLGKKVEDADKKLQATSGLLTTTVLNTKISEAENKIPDTSSLVTTAEYKKSVKLRTKLPIILIILLLKDLSS